MNILYKNIKLKEIEKDSLIKDSKLFAYIDSDFVNYGADIPNKENTLALSCEVKELTEDMTFRQMFDTPDTQWLTQGQVLQFIENNTDKLRDGAYATFFLLKSGEDFFVAGVYVYSFGLFVRVDRFGYVCVWDAEYRYRVVMPMNNEDTSSSTLKQKIVEKYGKSDGERFNKYFVEEENNDECFLWTGAHDSDGYGNWRIGGRKGKNIKPHRLTYEILNGEIPKGMVIDHLCRVRDCVNPEHMEAVTIGENVKRGNALLFGEGRNSITKIPQLETETLDTESLGISEPLSLTDEQCIERLKANGYRITKLIETEF